MREITVKLFVAPKSFYKFMIVVSVIALTALLSIVFAFVPTPYSFVVWALLVPFSWGIKAYAELMVIKKSEQS